MKKILLFIVLASLIVSAAGCSYEPTEPAVAATTMPVHCFTQYLCNGTPISVAQLVTESVSCLHDYSLQVSQMRIIEQADLVVISGGGLEGFLEDALTGAQQICDASKGIVLHCGKAEAHDHHGHSHENDPHFWLAPENAKIMAQNICHGLSLQYPQYAQHFAANLTNLLDALDKLQAYGQRELSSLQCRKLITFHDGFAYFAEAFDLTILEAVEEESGREASAGELIHLIQLANSHQLPAVFTEINGSKSAADVISAETGIPAFQLSMAMSGTDYFTEMYYNIDTIKEALG